MASNHHMAHESFSVGEQEVQRGTFPRWLTHQLCQEKKSDWFNEFPDNFHRITESQNRIGWKRPLRSSSPTINLTLPRPPLYHVPKHLIQTSFKYLQGWRLNHFLGQPVPRLDNPFSEEKFPNIQSKPPLAQLEAISSHPITCYLEEETNPHLSTTSFQLHCPSLDTLQHLSVSLVVRGPKLNTVFEYRVQGHDHFPSPPGHTIFDTSQDAIGFLGHLGTLLAHIQPAVNQHPQVLLSWAAFQPLFPKPIVLHGVVVAQDKPNSPEAMPWQHLDIGMGQESSHASRRAWGGGERERDLESASEDARFRVLPHLTMYGQRSHRVDLRKGLATARETPRDHPPPPAPAQKIENFLEQEPWILSAFATDYPSSSSSSLPIKTMFSPTCKEEQLQGRHAMLRNETRLLRAENDHTHIEIHRYSGSVSHSDIW
ncbi:hypothetical protein QYF61_015713 [Mycteria americana]|uniref:Uncharacterized protein n=1 Tax=Mycteria americana TaxID=33587 RepID=A0AAN7RKZ3_MYCAM|nr:hypothetical protein QYF61_015713 [Mycteria americana]